MVWKNIKQSVQYAFSLYFIILAGTYVSASAILLSILRFFGLGRIYKVMGWVAKCWINALACWTYYAFPSKFVVTIDPTNLKEASSYDTLTHIAIAFGVGSGWVDMDDERNKHHEIVISNHQIYSDWIYLWAFMNHLERGAGVKYALKRAIMFVPFFGLAMKVMNFIFLHRHWGRDMIKFDKRVRRVAEAGEPYSLIIFPEGTTMTEAARQNSQKHSKTKDCPELVNVLFPRSTGLYNALKALSSPEGRNFKPVEGILDLTVGYSGLTSKHIPETHYTLRSLYKESVGPEEIHINCAYIPFTDIPLEDKEVFTRWLVDRFQRKDQLLDQFFTEGRFEGIRSRALPITQPASYWYFWGLLIVSHVLSAATIFLCIR